MTIKNIDNYMDAGYWNSVTVTSEMFQIRLCENVDYKSIKYVLF